MTTKNTIENFHAVSHRAVSTFAPDHKRAVQCFGDKYLKIRLLKAIWTLHCIGLITPLHFSCPPPPTETCSRNCYTRFLFSLPQWLSQIDTESESRSATFQKCISYPSGFGALDSRLRQVSLAFFAQSEFFFLLHGAIVFLQKNAHIFQQLFLLLWMKLQRGFCCCSLSLMVTNGRVTICLITLNTSHCTFRRIGWRLIGLWETHPKLDSPRVGAHFAVVCWLYWKLALDEWVILSNGFFLTSFCSLGFISFRTDHWHTYAQSTLLKHLFSPNKRDFSDK